MVLKDTDVSDAGTEAQRFAAYEQVVASRTNALVGAGAGCSRPGRALSARRRGGHATSSSSGRPTPRPTTTSRGCDLRSTAGLERAYAALRARVRDGRPALLYIGNAWLPRHVVLVMPASGEQELDVYEPSIGRVVDLPKQAFVERRLRLAGWTCRGPRLGRLDPPP